MQDITIRTRQDTTGPLKRRDKHIMWGHTKKDRRGETEKSVCEEVSLCVFVGENLEAAGKWI